MEREKRQGHSHCRLNKPPLPACRQTGGKAGNEAIFSSFLLEIAVAYQAFFILKGFGKESKMYFWKVNNLVADFREDKVTTKEEMKYIIGYIILSSFLAWISLVVPLEHNINIFDHGALFSFAFLSVLGIYLCYRINSAGDNKDFATRMICISFPVTNRLVVFYIVIYLCFYFLLKFSDTTEWWEFVLWTAWLIIFLWYLCKKIKDVSV